MNRAPQLLGLALGLLLGLVLSFAPASWATRNGSGTYSLPSGNPVTTGTTISSTWANTTLSDLATEMTSSLDRNGKGAMLASLKLASGTSSVPGLAFSAETNTGLYRAGSGDIRLQLASNTVQKWTAQACTITGDTVVTAGSASGTGLTAQGNLDGFGVRGTGGDSNDAGSSQRGFGGYFVAGAHGTAGVVGYGSSSNLTGATYGSPGVLGVAAGTFGGVGGYFQGGAVTDGGQAGAGVYAVASTYSLGGTGTGGTGIIATASAGYFADGGLADGGTGGVFRGGSNRGAGIEATGGPLGGPGIIATGGTSGPGVQASAGNTATGTVRATALLCDKGDIDMNGVATVTSTTAMVNKLSPSNIVKSWGYFVGASAAPTVSAGFNVLDVSCGGNIITVTMTSGMASSDYAVVVTGNGGGATAYGQALDVNNVSATQFNISMTVTAGTAVNLCNAGPTRISFIVLGNQ